MLPSAVFWALASAGAVAWLVPLVQARLARWKPRHLLDSAPYSLTSYPRVTVVVPALDEQETIAAAMATLLALDYPDMEIVAVDDRSTDRTGEILDGMAASQVGERLRTVHIAALPSGWLGKNHALHVGAQHARGEFILFTDADVHFEPSALRRAVSMAVSRGLDHLVVFPDVVLRGFWETACVWFFGVLLGAASRPWDVPNPRSRAFMGIGAFNLVRADAYRRSGGHAALPMDVADDMKLGKVLKAAGCRADTAVADGLVSLRWIEGVRGLVTGLTKNMFGGLRFDPVRALGSAVAIGVAAVWPTFGLVIGPAGSRLLCAITLALMVWTARASRPMVGPSPVYGLAFPAAALIMIYIILRSMAYTYWQGGIDWRGTHYPLDELRRGVV